MIYVAVLAMLALASCRGGNAGLSCNYREADISTTADEHTVLAGFAARNGLSTELHHHLLTHCLVLSDSQKKVCIISNDLMELSPDISLDIRTRISEESGLPLENILLHCIHTHSAPRSGGDCSREGGTNHSYRERMISTIVDNAVQAIKSNAFKPFRIEVGKAQTMIGYNRCEADGPCDRDVLVARLTDLKGKPIVSIVNLACHPVCMGHRSLLVSSDYSGIACDRLREAWGGAVMQLSGAQGNIDPAQGPKDYLYAEACGNELADSLENMTFTAVSGDGKLAMTRNVAQLPYRKEHITPDVVRAHADSLVRASTDFPRFADDVRRWESEILARFDEGGISDRLAFEMEAVSVDGVVFFFSQGEPFCEYQTEARAAFPDKTILFAGYTNGQNSYLPSAHAFSHKRGYEYEIEQMHIYIKAPYPLSPAMPQAYLDNVVKTIGAVSEEPDRWCIVPQPRSIAKKEGVFTLNGHTGLSIESEDALFMEVADLFKEQVKNATGISLKNNDRITIRQIEGLDKEEYRLSVGQDRVIVEASSREGAFYGLQTLKQLLPAQIYGKTPARGIRWEAPCCEIEDGPAFEYRGMHLDVCRYFYPKEDVLKLIDLMAIHKQNVFHWHLTEDQGWRIEIDKYPKLIEIGSIREETSYRNDTGDGIPVHGYFTKDDVREVVEYARRRCIDVMPEIEIPGHSSAAIAAYPELSCTPDEPKKVQTGWGIFEDVYCPNEFTVNFLEDVFTEIMELFPFEYYHMGGDECPTTAWENSEFCHQFARDHGMESVAQIQDWFTDHFATFLSEHGKTAVGWDEILDGPAAQKAIAMSYRGHAPAANAIRRGIRCILTPDRWSYLNNPQEELENDGNFNVFMPLEKVYNYYPEVAEEPELSRKWIWGHECCIWAEERSYDLDLAVWPRASAAAEVTWTARENKDWDRFREGMVKEFERLDALDVDYCKAFWNVIYRFDNRYGYPRTVRLELDYPFAEVHYTLDGTEPTASSPLYTSELSVEKGGCISARGFLRDGTPVGTTSTKIF